MFRVAFSATCQSGMMDFFGMIHEDFFSVLEAVRLLVPPQLAGPAYSHHLGLPRIGHYVGRCYEHAILGLRHLRRVD